MARPKKETHRQVRVKKKAETIEPYNPLNRKYDAKQIAKDVLKYTESTDNPSIVDFGLQHMITKSTFYRLRNESPELAEATEILLMKQEQRTVDLTEKNVINQSWAQFKLKQSRWGWTEKQQIEHSGSVDHKVRALTDEDIDKELEQLKYDK